MLKKLIRNVFNFFRFVKAGPPSASSQKKDNIKNYIADSSHLLCQPAHYVHSVITFTIGRWLGGV